MLNNLSVHSSTNPTMYNYQQQLQSELYSYLYNSGSKPSLNPLVAQSLINNLSVNPSLYPTLYNYQQQLQSAINPTIAPSALNSMLNNSYLAAS
jgi:hypothetical protein